MTKKIILSLAALLFTVLSVMAVPAKKGIIEVQQPDGTTLNVQLHGDEYFNYSTTEDGYLVVNHSNGEWQYAKWENNKIINLGIKATNAPQRSATIAATLNTIGKCAISPKVAQQMNTKARAANRNIMPKVVGIPNPVPKGLVLLVSYSDVQFKPQHDNKEFSDLLNKEGYNEDGKSIGSAKDYFNDMSYGKYNPDFTVFGPYVLDNNQKYYGEDISYGGQRTDARSDQMIVDVFAKFMAAEGNNINLADYDQNNDGILDNVFIYFAGHNQAEGASSNAIWPHQGSVNASNVTGTVSYNGIIIKNYACTSELRGQFGSNRCGIGTFCHEFSHVLGLPDVYATYGSGDWKTSGAWEVMDQGPYNVDGHVPAAYSAYERFFMGWTTPTVLNTAGSYKLANLNANDTAAYLITSSGTHNLDGANPNPTIFYTLETRKQEGWDIEIPGDGMLITRINFNKSKWEQNIPNNVEGDLHIDLIEADGIIDFGKQGKPGDAFPGSENVTDYTPYQQYPITDITYNNDTIYFDFMGGIKPKSVFFHAGEYGTCDVDTLTETEIGEGITLPDVTPIGEYVFEGWSKKRSVQSADAGAAGDLFNMTENTDLYAVYSLNGEIVLGTCFIETFAGLTANSNDNIAREMDTYADNTGWTSDYLFQAEGAVKVGTQNNKGAITTPELNIQGTAKLKFRAMGQARGDLNIEVIGAGQVEKSSVRVYTIYQDYEMFFTGVDFTSKIKFSASINEFYIDSVDICLTDEVATDIITEHNIMVVNNQIISGLQNNDIVTCIDMNGRMLWTKESTEESITFTAPNGVYLITILRDGKILTIKNVNF